MNTPTVHRVAIAGATGRMGHMLLDGVRADAAFVLSGALDRADSPALRQDAGAFAGWDSGVRVTADPDAGVAGADCLIDFTRPEATLANLQACRAAGVAAVVGTTGFSDAQVEQIRAAAADIAIVMAPNMSVGVNVTLKLMEMAARALPEGYDVEILEAHHKHKVDAPSGTALKMGEVIAAARGRSLQDCGVFARQGHTGERVPGSIGFSVIRGGDIVGDHTALFVGTGERVEVTHRAGSRAGYVQGSLRAVRFLAGRKSGLFDMFDVLGLR